jgi:integrase
MEGRLRRSFGGCRDSAEGEPRAGEIPLRTVADILGHVTTAMTERYSHLLPEHKLKAVEMLPDWGNKEQRCEGSG